ncbi:hypothetical protein T11_3438 [Trichinella zimbabwensis]|uniref:Uncharacterized protein n=1 Tax=Trichinella zimbabwensis TaxID=268475 RepID=A0A0V1I4A6_9BILA|nr:hypothetical protein T11_3438 [Trichinella zimbabwensis]
MQNLRFCVKIKLQPVSEAGIHSLVQGRDFYAISLQNTSAEMGTTSLKFSKWYDRMQTISLALADFLEDLYFFKMLAMSQGRGR